ncbi:MAG: glycosyltransferase 87 family protein [Planctomycetota bacterium]
MPASPPSRRAIVITRLAWTIVVVAFVVGVIGALYRAHEGRPDWGDLQKEARYVWQCGHTAPGTAMFGYLPTTTFALWPFMVWSGWPVGAILFVLSNVLAGIGTIRIVWRHWLHPSPTADIYAWPVLLVSVNLAHAIQANQMTMWTLFLCVAGLALVERRSRTGRLGGGVLLGLAALIKTLPILLAGYLLLRRRWLALAGMAVAFALFDTLPSVAFFGWDGALDEHRAWLRRAEWHSNERQLDDPLLRVHRHGSNSSYSAVLARWLRPISNAQRQVILYGDPPAEVVASYRAALAPDEILTLDPMPPREGAWSVRRVAIDEVPRFHIAELPTGVLWWIWASTLAAGFLTLCWLTWRTAGSSAAWPAVAALWLLAMFWPSPMARHYYLTWAFPALAVVWAALDRAVRQRRTGATISLRLPVVALIGWGIGLACIGWRLPRWYGIHLAVLVLLMAAVAWAGVQLSRGKSESCEEVQAIEP